MATKALTTARMTKFEDVRDYVMAGKATFTLKSSVTDRHFTFTVTESDNNPDLLFVSLMTGPDNTNSFSYFGYINKGRYFFSPKSRVNRSCEGVVAWEWFFKNLTLDYVSEKLHFWHSGRCCHCNRKLSTPDSVANGWGPICQKTHRFVAE